MKKMKQALALLLSLLMLVSLLPAAAFAEEDWGEEDWAEDFDDAWAWDFGDETAFPDADFGESPDQIWEEIPFEPEGDGNFFPDEIIIEDAFPDEDGAAAPNDPASDDSTEDGAALPGDSDDAAPGKTLPDVAQAAVTNAAQQAVLASGTCGANVTWTLDSSGLLTISGSGEMSGCSWENSPWYAYKDSILSVVIQPGITVLCGYAFQNCSNIVSVELPQSIQALYGDVFYGCSSLSAVNLPDGIRYISENTFRDCSSLQTLDIPASVASIGNSAFQGCSSLLSITIPSGVERIQPNTFQGCSSLASVSIPSSVTKIGSWAFDGCSSLQSVNLTGYVTQIEQYAFNGCTAMQSITIPASVQTFGYSCFSNCKSLKEMDLQHTLMWSIPGYAFFDCTSLERVILPSTLSSIGELAFSGCAKLDGVVLPYNLTYIGRCAFGHCDSLSGISIPTGVKSIPQDAFRYCDNLTHIDIPGVLTIGKEAFYYCKKLTEITLPDGLTSIEEGAFTNCHLLTSIEIPASVTSIGNKAFSVYTSSQPLGPNTITFKGNAPTIGATAFQNLTANAFFPTGDSTWDAIVSANEQFGGASITWANGSSHGALKPVKITTQPVGTTGAVGATATFTVVAEGSGLGYQWYVSKDDGATWLNLGSSYRDATLSFTVKATQNNYLYRCEVKGDGFQPATSGTARLTVTPKITAQPKNYTGAVGDTVTMSVTATGAGLTYQWYISKNSGSTWASLGTSYRKASFTFELTEARNGYAYRCKVTDANGTSVTSNAATVRVMSAPVIKTQPQSYTGKLGDTVNLQVVAEGSGLSYQWYISKNNGSSWTSLGTSYRKASLSFDLTAARDGYQYRCVVKNSAGESVTSEAATVRVMSAPVIKTQPQSYTGKIGDAVNLSVVAEGSGLSYQWYISKNNGSSWTSLGSSYRQASLSFDLTAARDGYQYRCVVKNAAGESVTSEAATVRVMSAPVIKTQPQSYSGKIGDKVNLQVVAEGSGLSYQWYISKNNGSSWTSLGSSYRKASMSFDLTAARDGYQYRCVVKNSAGDSVTSAAATVRVLSGPVILTQPQSYAGALGDKVDLQVVASGTGLSYQWYLSKNNGSSWASLGTSYRKASMSFDLTAARDGYMYRCVVKDSAGNSVTSEAAIVRILPQESYAATGVGVDRIGPYSAVVQLAVNCNPLPEGPARLSIYLAVTPVFGQWVRSVSMGISEVMTNVMIHCPVGSLKPSTTYYYTPALTVGGQTYYGETGSFTTAAGSAIPLSLNQTVNCPNAGLELLYRFTAPAGGFYHIEVSNGVVQVEDSDDSWVGWGSPVTFFANAGATYDLYVHPYGEGTTLSVTNAPESDFRQLRLSGGQTQVLSTDKDNDEIILLKATEDLYLSISHPAVRGYFSILNTATGTWSSIAENTMPFLRAGESAYVRFDVWEDGDTTLRTVRPTGETSISSLKVMPGAYQATIDLLINYLPATPEPFRIYGKKSTDPNIRPGIIGYEGYYCGYIAGYDTDGAIGLQNYRYEYTDVDLEPNTTYYCALWLGDADGNILQALPTITVTTGSAPQETIQNGGTSAPFAAREDRELVFTPTVAGVYRFTGDRPYAVYLSLREDSRGILDSGYSVTFVGEPGKTYRVRCRTSDTDGVSVSLNTCEPERLSPGVNTFALPDHATAFTTFTPPASGTYTVTFTVSSGNAMSFRVYGENFYGSYPSGYPLDLEAGKTVYLSFFSYESMYDTATVTITKVL